MRSADFMYIDLDNPESLGWKDWIKENGVHYGGFTSFPMCGGVRLSAVINIPEELPRYVKIK